MAFRNRAVLRIFGFVGVAVLLVGSLCLFTARAETVRNASHLVPTGKGWGEEQSNSPFAVVTGDGISYHGGPIMPGTVNVYFIWYGNWSSGPKLSDRPLTVTLLNALFGNSGLDGSGYERINSTYGDIVNNVTGNIVLAGSTTDSYSQGKRISDSKVQAIVSRAISNGSLPSDATGIYFVLTSSDVAETSGFC